MDPRFPAPQCVIVDGDRIVAVGERALLGAYPEVMQHDLTGNVLVPGFIDAHHHLSIAALHPLGVARHSRVGGRALGGPARTSPTRTGCPLGAWRASGTSSPRGSSRREADLDAVGLDRPVLVGHYSLHQCVVSSSGLAELGIGRNTPDPPGGAIARDARGDPTGLLIERAWSRAHAPSLVDYAEPDRWSELIATRARELRRDGITALHDAACSPEAEAVYRSLARTGALPISVVVMPHAAELLENGLGTRLDGPCTGEGDETLRVGAVKLFADGGAAPAIDVHFGGQRVELWNPVR